MATSLRTACAAASRTLSGGGTAQRYASRTFAAALHRPPVSVTTWSKSLTENGMRVHQTIPAVLCLRAAHQISFGFKSPVQSRGIVTARPRVLPTSIAASSLARFSSILPHPPSSGTFSPRGQSRPSAQASPRFNSRRGLTQYHFRQYQGWEGDGPSPNKFTLLIRPLLFASGVVLTTFALAAIVRDERARASRKDRMMGRRAQKIDIMGWQLSRQEVIIGSIIGCNLVIFGCWAASFRGAFHSIEHAYPWLRRNFLHYPFSGRGFPLLGSAFSHITFPHLFFNMFALWSFGVLSSLGGMGVKLLMTSTAPSLGASGAVLFLAATTALIWPNAQFGIIFLPFISFPAPQLLLGVVAMDITGLVLRWGTFDHGAHLAAVATAVLFCSGGATLVARYQEQVIKQWRSVSVETRK